MAVLGDQHAKIIDNSDDLGQGGDNQSVYDGVLG